MRTTAAFFAPGTGPAVRPRTAHVTRRPGTIHHGLFRLGTTILPCALGRTGLTRFKREGDGATPCGRLALVDGYWRGDRALPPSAPVALTPTPADLGWCDDVARPGYNRPVRLPFAGSHETMRRDDALYDIVVVLDWNLRRRSFGGGSAIFFHQARPDLAATAGCVALHPTDMRRTLARLGRDPVIVIGGCRRRLESHA